MGRYAIWKRPAGTHFAGRGQRAYHPPTYLLVRLWDVPAPGQRGQCEILHREEPGRFWEDACRRLIEQAQKLNHSDPGPWRLRRVHGEWQVGDMLALRLVGTSDLGWVRRAQIPALRDALASRLSWEGTDTALQHHRGVYTLVSTRSSMYFMPLDDEAAVSLIETLDDALRGDYIHPATRLVTITT